MVAFVDPIAEGPPVREGDWLQFIYYLCLHWGIPGFSEKKVGRPREWTDQKRWQLFIDVMSLIQRRRMSERSACFRIARNPQKYSNRYPKDPKTLHREFQRAKDQVLAMPRGRKRRAATSTNRPAAEDASAAVPVPTVMRERTPSRGVGDMG